MSDPGTSIPDYAAAIAAAASDPHQLEQLYRSANASRAVGTFAQALEARYQNAPDNVLYAAWHYRLSDAASGMPGTGQPVALPAQLLRTGNWRLAIPLSVVLGIILWSLSDFQLTVARNFPILLLLWAPITGLFLVAYLALATKRHYVAAGIASVALIVATVYSISISTTMDSSPKMTYLTLMALHVPLLAACAVGYALLGPRSSATDRFGFLTKAIEALATAGVAVIVGGIFVGLTIGLFSVLNVEIPDLLLRLLVVGGGGLIPLLTVAAVYDPSTPPSGQDFRRGFGRILKILTWALLPLTLVVLVIYIIAIPFNFFEPFHNRDVLIVYNGVLFAILGLVVSATPVHLDEVPEGLRSWLRGALLAIVTIIVLVSIYALVAIVARTQNDGLTMNRVTVIGWNVLNISILVALLASQFMRQGTWLARMQGVFRWGTVAYLAWGAALLFALPWVAAQ